MRIEKSRPASASSSVRSLAPAGDKAAFSSALGGSAAMVQTQAGSGSMGVSSVAALMVLQAAEDPVEKKRRGARRGRQLLESLDQLKLDILSDKNPAATLSKLDEAMKTVREGTDDPTLESLLDQIELRVAVELAKQNSVR